MRRTLIGLIALFAMLSTSHVRGAEVTWGTGLVDSDDDISADGTVVEAAAFTGDLDRNSQPGTFPLDEPFIVNGTTFTPLNFSQGDSPVVLSGLTYNDGEFGHSLEDSGYQGILGGLAFEGGTGTQNLQLTNLTVNQSYLVEFYYFHSTANRTVTFSSPVGNSVIVEDEGLSPDFVAIGGYAAGCFTADATTQDIESVASTGSHYLSGYQLREVSGFVEKCTPPIIDPPPPASPPALIGYWNFDGDTDDHSGKENHGFISGGVDYDDDVPAILGGGQSALFDGFQDSHIDIEHNQMMPVTSHRDFTLSMWVRGDGTIDNVDDRIFSEGQSTDNNPIFTLGTQNEGADGRFDVYIRNGTAFGHVYSVEEPFDDDWHHIVWVDRDNVGTLYIDGEEDSTFDYSAIPEFEADITSIGSVLRAGDCCNFTGNIDDVSAFSFALDEESILLLANGVSPLSIPIPGSVLGDFDNDGELTVADIDLLSDEVLAGTNNTEFDLDNDGLVNAEDHRVWVEDLKNTYFGDANLDLEFNSSDFVAVFQAGEYEDAIPGNSSWATGDWNADKDFSSSDFVKAFQAGGYEQGPRPAVSAVPEPGSLLLLGLASWGLLVCRRR